MRFIFFFAVLFLNLVSISSSADQINFQKEQEAILRSKEISGDGKRITFGFNLKKDFSYYIDHSIRLVKKGRNDLNNYLIFTIRGNSPFVFEPPIGCAGGEKKKFKNGILLIHDLGASPYQMQHLGHIFNNKCMLVYSILLVGHGTKPIDLTNVSYAEWMKQVNYAAKELAKNVDNVYIAGAGMGSTLALNYSLDDDTDVKGLFLFSPAVTLSNKKKVFLSKMSSYFNVWSKLNKNTNRVAYDNIPYSAYSEFSNLSYLVQNKIKGKKSNNMKLFAVFSQDDDIVDYYYSNQLLRNSFSGDNSKFIVYYGINGNSSGEKRDIVNIYDSEKGIYDIYGSSIVVPPYDWWYGEYPAYKSCNHYFNQDDIQLYKRCLEDDSLPAGATSYYNLKRGVMRGNTYNPAFNDLRDELNKFIDIKVLGKEPIIED